MHKHELKLELVVTDLAGTTVDFGSCAPAGAFIELFRRHGILATLEEAREPMGLHKRDHIARMATMPSIQNQWVALRGGACTSRDIDEFYREFIPIQVAALRQYCGLIPGTQEAIEYWRRQGAKIVATTGYNQEMMGIVLEEAALAGFIPDSAVCAEQLPAGRPAPWLVFRAMQNTGIYPPAAVINIGDTLADVASGRNAGVWSIGVAATGNMVGLDRGGWEALPGRTKEMLLKPAKAKLLEHGAHYAVDGIADCPRILEEINAKLAAGERP